MELKLENAFNELNINNLTNGLDNLPAYKLAGIFRDIATQIDDGEKKLILGSFEHICIYSNNIENINFGDKHSEICNLLAKKVSYIDNSLLKAIIGEMLFKLNKDYRVLELTVDSYIDSFEKTFSTEQWVPCFEYIEKALNISKLLGKKNSKKNICLEKMYTKLKSSYSNDRLYLSSKIITLLIVEKYGDSSELYNICIDRADEAEKEKEFRKSRTYLELCIKDYIAKDNEKKNNIRKRIARTYEEDAKYTLEKDETNYLVAAHHIEGAIEVNRKISNNKSKIDELHKLMMFYQQESIKYMKEISCNIELPKEMSEIINNKIDFFKGKDKEDVLKSFAFFEEIPEKETIKRQVEEESNLYPLQNLFPSVNVNEKGKKISKDEGSNLGDNSADIENKMYSRAKLYFDMQTITLSEPIRKVIIEEHSISEDDLYEILNDNYIIPEDRIKFYAKGFVAGFNGDFIVSSHLLIPQLENSIRYILEKNGVVVTTISNNGIQEEKNVNTLLKEEKLVDLFGEDLIFILRALLIEKSGDNFRNDISHGLMSYERCEGNCAKYLWWIAWRICVLYKLYM
ncbi:DUF4209 domain-containing protein [[Clostridium] dakarense]|uniref:DUF4209 domain-containing protein n=1 Tax=Faecalimicrobium dakarense TaxID=1301100 RepID=UPI0004BB2264|nr:DUF4209 domain-containing protein [[Clostridium] dakarense]